MTSLTSSPPHLSHHRSCRIVRNPALLLVVALIYAVSLLVFRGGDGLRFTALRGSSAAIDATDVAAREAAQNWEPEKRTPGTSYGVSARGPVKGGVEIYPVQSARRVRTASVPIVPEVEEIEGVLTAWKMPQAYHKGGGEAMKGLYVLFHGCSHGPLDWCWTYNVENGDVNPVKAMLWRWYRNWSIPPNTPLFLFGASSGGKMATLMASTGGFQLCEKRSTYVQVSGALSQVSWGIPAINYGTGCPPLGFMPMPKGEPVESGDDVQEVPQVFGNSRKIPPQITSIAHYVRKSGGRPRMLFLPLGELSFYKAFFSDRVYEISVDQSARLHAALLAAHVIECDSSRYVDGEKECFLKNNPRDTPKALETLIATYDASLEGLPRPSADSNDTVAVTTTVLTEDSKEQDGEIPLLQPSSGRYGVVDGELPTGDSAEDEAADEMRFMSTSHATEVFRELLNVAWGAHEISADFVGLWEKWLWESCGSNCRQGSWG
eukprot:jgi/Undpi1/14257/HiC_scaffold_9.g03906.m1